MLLCLYIGTLSFILYLYESLLYILPLPPTVFGFFPFLCVDWTLSTKTYDWYKCQSFSGLVFDFQDITCSFGFRSINWFNNFIKCFGMHAFFIRQLILFLIPISLHNSIYFNVFFSLHFLFDANVHVSRPFAGDNNLMQRSNTLGQLTFFLWIQ